MNRKIRRFAPLAVAALLAGVSPSAQQVGGVPREPICVRSSRFLESTYIRMPLPAGEEKYGRLDGARMKEFLRPHRRRLRHQQSRRRTAVGTDCRHQVDDMVEGVVERRFKEFGLQEVNRQVPSTCRRSGFRQRGSLRPRAAGRRSSSRPRRGDAHGGVTGRWTRTRSGVGGPRHPLRLRRPRRAREIRPDSVDADARRCRAFGGTYIDASQRAAEHGAAAVAFNVAIPGNFQVQTGPGNNRVPTFTLGTDDMAALREAMERGAVKVHVRLATEMRSGLRDASVWGVLPGTTNEDIVIMAHHDSFFYGAMDNASGMSVMLGLARHSKLPAEPAAPDAAVRDDVRSSCGLARHGLAARQPRDGPCEHGPRYQLRTRVGHAGLLRSQRAGPAEINNMTPAGGGSMAAAAWRRSRRTRGRCSASRPTTRWRTTRAATCG